MRILTYDELPASMETDRALLHLSAFGGTLLRSDIETARRGLGCTSDYTGVFAVERGQLWGQVYVLRIPYAFRDGPGVLSAIAGVGTRPDRGRTGVARALLEEAHRRERDAGMRYIGLWTNRSWGAHRLYEKLGYRDVYSSPWVVRLPPRTAPKGRRASGPRPRPARRADLAAVDRLHERMTADRLGYYRRSPQFSETERRIGMLDPAKNILVVREAGELRGYAHVDRSHSRLVCGEIVASSRSHFRRLVADIVRRARGVPVAFQHSAASEDPSLFRGEDFRRTEPGWYGMMGADLQAPGWSPREATRQFATDDRRFVCFSRDRF